MSNISGYKLLRYDLTHFKYTYKLGLNILEESFNTDTYCSPGGFYFCKREHIFRWLGLYDNLKYICEVELLPDSQLTIEYKEDKQDQLNQDKLKTDKLILKNKMLITDFLEKEFTREELLTALTTYSSLFKFIKNINQELCNTVVKTHIEIFKDIPEEFKQELCMEVLSKNGEILKYVKNQTKEMCLTAINNSAYSVNYINTDLLKLQDVQELQLFAIKQDSLVIKYVTDPTEEMISYALQKDSYNIRYIKKPTVNMLLTSIQNNGLHIYFLYEDGELYNTFSKQDRDMLCLESVKQNGSALQHINIKDFTYELCLVAVQQNGLAIQYIKDFNTKDNTRILSLAAVKQTGKALKYIKDQTEEMCNIAITKDIEVFQDVHNMTPTLCELAVSHNGHMLKYIRNKTPKMCLLAITQNGFAIRHLTLKETHLETEELYLIALKQDKSVIKYFRKSSCITQEVCKLAEVDYKVACKNADALFTNERGYILGPFGDHGPPGLKGPTCAPGLKGPNCATGPIGPIDTDKYITGVLGVSSLLAGVAYLYTLAR